MPSSSKDGENRGDRFMGAPLSNRGSAWIWAAISCEWAQCINRLRAGSEAGRINQVASVEDVMDHACRLSSSAPNERAKLANRRVTELDRRCLELNPLVPLWICAAMNGGSGRAQALGSEEADLQNDFLRPMFEQM